MSKYFPLLFLFVFLTVVFAEASDESVGSLRMNKGDVTIERGGKIINAEDVAPVFRNDTVQTGANGSVGIVFKDNSRIGLGPNSRLDLKKFVFDPAQGQYSMINKLTKGTASYISGKMTKLSPESVIMETPTSTIGVRGTAYHVNVKGD
jgi:hypothetical protein